MVLQSCLIFCLGHSNDLGQYSGVLPPVTLGGGGRGGAGTAVQSQYTPGISISQGPKERKLRVQ